MDAESKDLLREWLVRSLEPVCDADPEVLSKYVLALIQNDPKKDGLKDTCISKLEEFLGDETTPFVNRLFVALDSESYRKGDRRQDEAAHDRDNGRDHHSHHHGHHQVQEDDHHYHESSRRRGRASLDEDDDQARYNKRRRDDDYARDVRRHDDSPRRGGSGDGRRDGYGGRGGGGRGPRDWEREGRGYPMGGDRRRNFPPEWGMPPPGMWPPHFPPPRGGFPPHPMGDFDPNMYNPENPGMMPPPMMMGPRHMGGGPYYPYPGRGRGGRGFQGRGPPRGEDGASPAPGGDNSVVSMAKTTLRVTNVDPKYVNMTKLSLHFSKFGNVVNVQMRPNHKCAYVQYATEEEAKKAFHSPYPVCNNRFIEVKWAKYDAKDPQGAPTEEAEESKDNGDEASAESDAKSETDDAIKPAATEAPPTEMTPEELRAAALEKGRKVLEEKRELLEKQKQLAKQKEELLKRQLAQQKELLERMSQNPAAVSAADKRELLNKITTLSEELKTLQRGREATEANKLTALKAELTALEAAAAPGGAYVGGRGRGRGPAGGRWGGVSPSGGRGFYRGGAPGRGGRGGRVYSNTLDNRTTIVKVENLPEEARDPSVLEQHFGNFGGIEKVVVDTSAPDQGYIKFQDRYSGQTALTRGGMFGQARLQLSWVEAQDAPPALRSATPQHANGENSSADTANDSAEVQASA